MIIVRIDVKKMKRGFYNGMLNEQQNMYLVKWNDAMYTVEEEVFDKWRDHGGIKTFDQLDQFRNDILTSPCTLRVGCQLKPILIEGDRRRTVIRFDDDNKSWVVVA